MMKQIFVIALVMINIFIIHSRSNDAVESNYLKIILENYKDQPKKEVFKAYHKLYEKKYDLNTEEGLSRYRIFKDNLKFIEETNTKNLAFKLGIGPFTDLTNEEFKEKHLMKTNDLLKLIKSESDHVNTIEAQGDMNFKLGITKIDWTSTFRPVLKQGNCGSCWAFATVAALEGNYQKNFGDYLELSHQQLVDCDTYDSGCNGGWPSNTLTYVKENGLVFESSYPYTSGYNGYENTCQLSSNHNPNYILDSAEECTYGYCRRSSILSMLSRGPLIGVMDAEGNGYFKDYKSGILDIPCSQINHAINIIGVDSDAVSGYYIGRNSWGKDWGENGNFRMRFNDSTQSCLMDVTAWRPNVKRISNPIPPPPTPACARLYSSCYAQGTSYDICSSTPNYNGLSASFTIGTAKKVRFYLSEKCRGSYFTYDDDISCLADTSVASFSNQIKSTLVDWDLETPPAGCVWVYSGCCFTNERREFCNSIPNLAHFGFSNKISSIRLGSGVISATLADDTYYYGSRITYSSKDVSCIHPVLESRIISLKINK